MLVGAGCDLTGIIMQQTLKFLSYVIYHLSSLSSPSTTVEPLLVVLVIAHQGSNPRHPLNQAIAPYCYWTTTVPMPPSTYHDLHRFPANLPMTYIFL